MPARINSRRHKADIAALYDYADKAFDKLCDSWGLRPPQERYVLLVMPRPGGGFAAGDVGEARAITGKRSPGIGCSYDAFFNTAHGIKAYWAHILITHEMVNLFTGQVVSGGWPVDWWANHRSPFPLMTAVQIEYALVPEMAIFHERDGRKDPLVGMFMHLKDQFGWAMFRKAFRTAIDDRIRWDAFAGNPSELARPMWPLISRSVRPKTLARFWNRWSQGMMPKPCRTSSRSLEMVGVAPGVIPAPGIARSLPQGILQVRPEIAGGWGRLISSRSLVSGVPPSALSGSGSSPSACACCSGNWD